MAALLLQKYLAELFYIAVSVVKLIFGNGKVGDFCISRPWHAFWALREYPGQTQTEFRNPDHPTISAFGAKTIAGSYTESLCMPPTTEPEAPDAVYSRTQLLMLIQSAWNFAAVEPGLEQSTITCPMSSIHWVLIDGYFFFRRVSVFVMLSEWLLCSHNNFSSLSSCGRADFVFCFCLFSGFFSNEDWNSKCVWWGKT